MPSYRAINKKTKEETEFFCSISEMEQWEKDNPKWEVQCGTPLLHAGFMTGESKSDSWNSLLKTIKKRSGKNNTIKLRK